MKHWKRHIRSMMQTLLEAAVKDKLFSNKCYTLLTVQYSYVVLRHAAEQMHHPQVRSLAFWSKEGWVDAGSFALFSINIFKWEVPRGSKH